MWRWPFGWLDGEGLCEDLTFKGKKRACEVLRKGAFQKEGGSSRHTGSAVGRDLASWGNSEEAGLAEAPCVESRGRAWAVGGRWAGASHVQPRRPGYTFGF